MRSGCPSFHCSSDVSCLTFPGVFIGSSQIDALRFFDSFCPSRSCLGDFGAKFFFPLVWRTDCFIIEERRNAYMLLFMHAFCDVSQISSELYSIRLNKRMNVHLPSCSQERKGWSGIEEINLSDVTHPPPRESISDSEHELNPPGKIENYH